MLRSFSNPLFRFPKAMLVANWFKKLSAVLPSPVSPTHCQKLSLCKERQIKRLLIVFPLSAYPSYVDSRLMWKMLPAYFGSLCHLLACAYFPVTTWPPVITQCQYWCQPNFFPGRKRRLGLLGAKRTTITVHRWRIIIRRKCWPRAKKWKCWPRSGAKR